MNNFTKKTIFLTIIVLFLLSPFLLSAKMVYEPLAPLPNVTAGEDLGGYLESLFNFLIGLAAILAVFMIALGGAWYIGSDSISGKGAGKEFIRNALMGLVLALVAWVILNTINPNLLNLDFDPGSDRYEVGGGDSGDDGSDDGGGEDEGEGGGDEGGGENEGDGS